MSKSITKATAREIANKIKAFVGTLEDEYGIEVIRNSTSYTNITCDFTVKTRIKEELRGDGVLTREEQRYDLEAHAQNLPPRGTIFKNHYNEEFVINAWIPKGRKFKISGTKCDDGRAYKFEVIQIKTAEIVRLGTK